MSTPARGNDPLSYSERVEVRLRPAFPQFFATVKPFFNEIDEMKHSEVRANGPT